MEKIWIEVQRADRKARGRRWLLPLPLVLGTLVALPPAEAQERSEKPVAVIGEEAIYEKDYLTDIRAEAYDIRVEEYNLKLQALKDLIDKRLLKEEAEAQGVTQEELAEREILALIPEPDEEEVEQRFVQQMFSSMRQMTKSKDDIRAEMKREGIDEMRELYFLTLRERAGVRIFLPRPRMQVDYDPSRVRGNAQAPITMVEFSDFQCPYCLQAYTTVKNLLRKYEGKIRLAYRDLPLLEARSGSVRSADAARCALEQGKFWEYHDLLFENQDYRGLGAFREFAGEVGMEMDSFNECLTSGRYTDVIQEDFDEGIALGIRGTPYFFINGVPVNGARPQPEFEQIIEEELALLE